MLCGDRVARAADLESRERALEGTLRLAGVVGVREVAGEAALRALLGGLDLEETDHQARVAVPGEGERAGHLDEADGSRGVEVVADSCSPGDEHSLALRGHAGGRPGRRLGPVAAHEGSAIEAVHQLFQLQNAKYSSVQHAVLEQDDFSVLYEWLLIGSDPHPDQHEVARMIEGHQGLHRVAYVHKGGRLTEAERAEWMDLLRSSKVILGSEPIR